ncbi:hypothetical protein MMC07_001076, partial [Pseudocyphellaria aurata]|nr:hypothetical protein [Pseudocyphellaria aurata]
MANVSKPTNNPDVKPKPSGIFKDTKGRMWTADAFDQLVVGHTHVHANATMATRFGASKWKVPPSGLSGGPASWKRSIKDVLWEYHLNCTVYVDDILT